ncbi:hypothetical protein Sinac_7093 [Singulisphaera acidiphila DSM 18658]|uniref:Uncharacterized protein n=1 Tax=Singulisphaera acidiphila (strain ATCC BAA-1392 / DSM 18658 / VKM B-2454 / MOB10) TaxID=886293 RepID=L0DPG2_SINAD|nr:hypothetical protein Sinac_7093 [Singulisphaera acidiphila DSM 18658]
MEEESTQKQIQSIQIFRFEKISHFQQSRPTS